MKTYKDVYKLPLEEDHGWIYDQKRNFVFQFLIDDEEKEKKILDVINGYDTIKNKDIFFTHENGYIKSNKGYSIILIRGWGNLTGVGAMNLSDIEATNIQNTFAEFILGRLNFRGKQKKTK